MKQHKTLLTYMLLAVLGLTACKKALELNPITEYANANFWKETTQATAALNGAYTLLQAAMGPEGVFYGEARADNVAQNLTSLNTESLNLLTNNVNPSLRITNWSQLYAVVNQANLIIQNVRVMNQSGLYANKTAEYNQTLGQAYALRALCYFNMTRIWGELPIVTKPLKDATENYYVEKSDTAKVYARIELDLDSATVLLPTSYAPSQTTKALLTAGAVNAIYTDLYMWRHQYEKALTASQKIISNTSNYSLTSLTDATALENTSYARQFTHGFSTESIFEIDFNFAERGARSFYIQVYGDIGFQPAFQVSVPLMTMFSPSDKRATISYNERRDITKFFDKTNFVRSTMDDKNIIMYRLSDILLLRAEALNQLNRPGDAITIVNQMKVRAGETGLLPTDYNNLTKSQVEDIILNERSKELCFEGKRWFDLVRTGKAISVMQPINGLNNVDNYVWPISLNEIRLNPLLKQNAYYQ
ncbi:RagB/SusD family nutrient uptake outer membrane protein [Pedobacter chitinilyticus]|uniref:RagB/SusD family nutrient uptake outer membrane protein n=1 Tax=Pedobacter chitinilyticus TaxID=2233776 RepID=A0A443Z234_9SPHI|nr:RagB/SusD family nutrient uptake outer membrane protein [Pedobacter chitinilyticus]RWU10597.1 RagB/SusD family nutrient uptake outer membrane protein [Pedobacter chitinilyticus]